MKRKMTITGRIGCMILGLSLLSMPVLAATDYNNLTNEEMAAKRGTMRDATSDDRDAFRTEWQTRVNNMSQEERQLAVGRPQAAQKDGTGHQYGQGGGHGGGNGGGRGMGGGRR